MRSPIQSLKLSVNSHAPVSGTEGGLEEQRDRQWLQLCSPTEKNGFVKFLALIRGINVGGKNSVSMARLRTCVEQLQMKNVSTYIQSGNILFESRHRDPLRLSSAIEIAITEEFGFPTLVVVVPEPQLERVITQAPPAFGVHPAQFRYDVVFLKPPLLAPDILSTIRLKDGVDQAFADNDVLYFQRLNERASQSHLPKLTAHPVYKSMTIRNWKTTTGLHRLMSRTDHKSNRLVKDAEG